MNKKILVGLSVLGVSVGFWACGDGAIESMTVDDDVALANYSEFNPEAMTSLVQGAMAACEAEPECAAKMEGSTYVPPEQEPAAADSGATPATSSDATNTPANSSPSSTPASSPAGTSSSGTSPNTNPTVSSSSTAPNTNPTVSSSSTQSQTQSSSSQQQTQPSSSSQNGSGSGDEITITEKQKKIDIPKGTYKITISGGSVAGCQFSCNANSSTFEIKIGSSTLSGDHYAGGNVDASICSGTSTLELNEDGTDCNANWW